MQCVCECTRKSQPLSGEGLDGFAALTARFFTIFVARVACDMQLANPHGRGAAGDRGDDAHLPVSAQCMSRTCSVRAGISKFGMAAVSSKRITVASAPGPPSC